MAGIDCICNDGRDQHEVNLMYLEHVFRNNVVIIESHMKQIEDNLHTMFDALNTFKEMEELERNGKQP